MMLFPFTSKPSFSMVTFAANGQFHKFSGRARVHSGPVHDLDLLFYPCLFGHVTIPQVERLAMAVTTAIAVGLQIR